LGFPNPKKKKKKRLKQSHRRCPGKKKPTHTAKRQTVPQRGSSPPVKRKGTTGTVQGGNPKRTSQTTQVWWWDFPPRRKIKKRDVEKNMDTTTEKGQKRRIPTSTCGRGGKNVLTKLKTNTDKRTKRLGPALLVKAPKTINWGQTPKTQKQNQRGEKTSGPRGGVKTKRGKINGWPQRHQKGEQRGGKKGANLDSHQQDKVREG